MLEVQGVNSKEISSSATVTTANKTGLLYGITLLSGTTASSVIIKNGGSSGTTMWKLSLIATTGAGDQCTSITFPAPIVCSTDIYATLAGTGALAYVSYREIG